MTKVSDQYKNKIAEFILPELSELSKPKILEFGVRFGVSTNLFLEICEKKNGFLHSIDMDDCSKVANSKNWQFHLSRDDNYDYLDKILPNDIDLIYLDSFHNADHIEKIFYHYFKKLKVSGLFIFDDISWLPYLKKKERNNFNCEINNLETFERILNIYSENEDKLELSFSFVGSGMAKIKKIDNKKLSISKPIITRKLSFKNIIRKTISRLIKKS